MTKEKWWCFACHKWHPRSVTCSITTKFHNCEPYCDYQGWIKQGKPKSEVEL